MPKNNLKRLATLLGLSAFVVALCLHPQPGLAKLNPAPGKDGAPPNPQTEAEVDALNEALDGQHDSQTPSTAAIPRVDMCQSPLHNWLTPGSDKLVVEALSVPSVRSDLVNELEDFLHHLLRIETAGTDVVLDRPEIDIRCDQCAMTYTECLAMGHGWEWCKRHYLTCPQEASSKLSITVPATQRTFGVPIARGTVTADASASYRAGNASNPDWPEWCISIHDYAITGFDLTFIRDRINTVFGDRLRCGPESAPQ